MKTKKGDKGYDPTQKYWPALDVMMHNMNLIILKAGKDATMDGTTCLNSCYVTLITNLSTRKQIRLASM